MYYNLHNFNTYITSAALIHAFSVVVVVINVSVVVSLTDVVCLPFHKLKSDILKANRFEVSLQQSHILSS